MFNQHYLVKSLLCILLGVFPTVLAARELNDKLRVNTVATGVWQYGDYTNAVDNEGQPLGTESEGSVAVDVAVDYRPTVSNQVFALASYAKGNGLKGLGGVSVQVNADDLEDDVKDINGSGRDYLLEAWYRHNFQINPRAVVSATAGIIDATNYLDHNRLANDEITQFMNEAFVNRAFLPSYDPGVALGFAFENWHVDAVWMDADIVTDQGRVGYTFYGADVGVSINTRLGAGDYHLIVQSTDRRFASRGPSTASEQVNGITLSLDQQLAERVGVFARLGGSNRGPDVLVHNALYSAGLTLRGGRWQDPVWELGIGYAYLKGAGDQPGDIDSTRVFETYARYQFSRFADISLDVQYVSDTVIKEPDPQLWAVGVRLNGYY
jgi:porin